MDGVDQSPFDCTAALDPFRNGTEEIGEVAADLAFVDDARQTAGAWEDAEERDFDAEFDCLVKSF